MTTRQLTLELKKTDNFKHIAIRRLRCCRSDFKYLRDLDLEIERGLCGLFQSYRDVIALIALEEGISCCMCKKTFKREKYGDTAKTRLGDYADFLFKMFPKSYFSKLRHLKRYRSKYFYRHTLHHFWFPICKDCKSSHLAFCYQRSKKDKKNYKDYRTDENIFNEWLCRRIHWTITSPPKS